ncbi:hypothetical protein K2173_006474 [Erythroxylum novogranatense]|uniref:C2H2-type domain-containing protein n=1 Tax=Erythroxylum novogranatense TaxID=1862640 RepID=A0AAV8TCJ1_9ROSI|nr:hypothetical protein K2173_006474 [Erythroxylum novogranatense]
MESQKQASPETSSEENDVQEQVKQDKGTTSTTQRSYECTFCKRGFTNAQALGGHMNIHRKDRAKGKHVPSSSAPSKVINNEEYMNPSYPAAISSDQPRYYPVFGAQRNYELYYQQSGSNPRQERGYYHSNDVSVPNPRSLRLSSEELWGTNLSLQIGTAATENSQLDPGTPTENEINLDLRLGYGP